MLHELAGRPALERVQETIRDLDEAERAAAANGLHMGRVVDEHKLDFDRGDFLVRNVLGADKDNGAVAVGDEVEVGATVQFHVRDAVSADADLRLLLDGQTAKPRWSSPATAGASTCLAEPHHDAGGRRVRRHDRSRGHVLCRRDRPGGRRTFVHGFTATSPCLPTPRPAVEFPT